MKYLPVLITVTMGWAASMVAAAETVFIRDQLFVPLRGGQSTEYRIIHKGIPSGTALELLEGNEETGYSRIRMGNGVEGWIQTQYLTTEPIARDQVRSLRQEIQDLENGAVELEEASARLEESIATLSAENAGLTQLNENLTHEVERITRLAANVIAIDEQNRSLKEDNSLLLSEVDTLSSLNLELENRRTQEWYVIGGSSILISILLGIWLGRRIYRRSNSGGWS